MNSKLTDKDEDLIARSWIRYFEEPETYKIPKHRKDERSYKDVLSVKGDVWIYEDSPYDVLGDVIYNTPDCAFTIVLKIADMTNDEWVLELLASGPLEDLISHHDNAQFYLNSYVVIARQNPKHTKLLSMVWF